MMHCRNPASSFSELRADGVVAAANLRRTDGVQLAIQHCSPLIVLERGRQAVPLYWSNGPFLRREVAAATTRTRVCSTYLRYGPCGYVTVGTYCGRVPTRGSVTGA
jgi:hypothetical protein